MDLLEICVELDAAGVAHRDLCDPLPPPPSFSSTPSQKPRQALCSPANEATGPGCRACAVQRAPGDPNRRGAACHARGARPGCSKPDNILVDPENKRLILIDFGSAAAMGLEQRGARVSLSAPSQPMGLCERDAACPISTG